MINIFLRAKHWQLFLLMFGLPFVLQFSFMGYFIGNAAANQGPDPDLAFGFMSYVFPLIMVIYLGIFFGWFWSITIGLKPQLPPDLELNFKRFKIFFFFPLIYILVILFGISLLMNSIANQSVNEGFAGGIVALIIPLHLFSMFCIFHTIYFAAKTLKSVELQREVKFGDFAGDFLLLWFYFIGVWIVQPRINKLSAVE